MRVMPPKGGPSSAMRFSAHGFLLSDRINRMDKMSSEKSNGAGNSVDSVNSVEESDSDRINKVDKMVSEGSDTSNSGDSVHSVEKQSSDTINKMGKMGSESGTSNSVNSVENPLPNLEKIFVAGKLHPDIRVPFREITLAPTKTMNGGIEVNEPVRVYDTSGPWGDPSVTLDPVQGLPALRREWILGRGDVQEIEGRAVQAIDDGYLSEGHAAIAAQRRTSNPQRPTSNGKGDNSSFVIRH